MIDILNYTFFQNALWAILLISITSAIIGTYIVARRMLFITGGITHASFGGLGVGYYLGINPTLSALVFAILSALGVEWLSRGKSVREDSAIAVVWALGMAIGIIFIFMTPGYTPGLTEFLFGNILTITRTDIFIFAAFASLLIFYTVLQYKTIVYTAFDADFAHTRGIKTRLVNYIMTFLWRPPWFLPFVWSVSCSSSPYSLYRNDRRTFLSQIPKYRLAVGSNQSPLRHRRTITLLLARRPCGSNHRIYLDNRLFCCKNYSFLPTFCNR